MIELTLFTKSGGPLTKRISLAPDGKVISDGSACVVANGEARRIRIENMNEFAALIEEMRPVDAITLGSLRRDIDDPVRVVTKRKLNGLAGIIARTATDIVYRQGEPAAALFDFDSKGMPDGVRVELDRFGGYWPALVSVLPVLANAARLTRRSTSAGLSRADTGEALPGGDGVHIYTVVKDGSDVERFLKTLHERCWLAGLGWLMVGAGGQLLDRSIIDRAVFGPERLVFEGGPILNPPLQQDRESRRPIAVEGDVLDSKVACPPLSTVELARLKELKAIAGQQLAEQAADARAAFIKRRAKKLSDAKGIPIDDATRAIKRQCEGVLVPVCVLPFDDDELKGSTVADVLADSDRFEGATLADPMEGVDYGTGKARIMRRDDGSLWIHSFAHGRTTYELKRDMAAARAMLERAEKSKMVDLFIDLALNADLNNVEIDELRRMVANRTEAGLRELDRLLKDAQAKVKAEKAKAALGRWLAERCKRDQRPRLPVPMFDDAWLPVVEVINSILGAVMAAEPPARDADGGASRARKISLPGLHLFGCDDNGNSLPAPEQWLLRRMDDVEVAEMIETYIDYIDYVDEGYYRSVHLPMSFVRHYVQRDDGVLPTVVAISTLPLVLPDGSLLTPDGLDRDHGIIFKVQEEVRGLIPDPADCDDDAVAKAMRFLCDEWLVDVATEVAGKCTLIAAALTLIERTLLPDRPAFFVSAGRRGGGKTTALIMLIMAVLGQWPAAAAWSTNEEERRKALLSYFMSGVPYILWDNIPRGMQITCPHVERSCTSAYYADRKLGVSEMISTAASSIHFFTGNNVSPRGDLASRSLMVRIEVNRPDPENRTFTHPDPIGWTEQNRAKILRALYSILLGNPMLSQQRQAERTRFKLWWRLVGSAVEHAAMLIGREDIDFQSLFLAQEGDDEDSTALAEALTVLRRRWRAEFKASDVANLINMVGADASLPIEDLQEMKRDSATLREFLFETAPSNFVASAKAVGKRLRAHVDEPVWCGDDTLVLRARKGRGDISLFSVGVTP
jgi:hypothetical protein